MQVVHLLISAERHDNRVLFGSHLIHFVCFLFLYFFVYKSPWLGLRIVSTYCPFCTDGLTFLRKFCIINSIPP
jgi:hypothetical protein